MLNQIEVHDKTCYMLIGLPGSGKSFVVNNLIALNPQLKVASSDYYIDQYAKNNNVSYNVAYRELNGEHFKLFSARISELLKNSESFIWDQVNTSISARGKKIRRLLSSHYNVVALVLDIPEEIILQRLKERESINGKIIKSSVLKEMKEEYQAPTYSEGFNKIYKINQNLNIKLVEENITNKSKLK